MKRRTLVLAAALAACSSPTLPAGDPQRDALARLDADTGTTWSVRYHDDLGTPAFLVGKTSPLLSDPSHAAKAATAFLERYKALFRLGDATSELHARATRTDALGMTHVRLEQRAGGVPVEGGELVVHFDAQGELVRIHGRYIPLTPPSLIPTLDESAATSAALAAAHATRPLADDEAFAAQKPALVVDPLPTARLAWRTEVLVDDPIAPGRLFVFVDATTGAPMRTVEALDTLEGKGVGVFGDVETLEIVAKKSRYVLENPHAGKPASSTYSAAGKGRLPGREVASADPDRWDESGPGAGAAVDAHAFVGLTSDYFATRHGRAGAFDDGKGLRASVHFGDAYPGAFFNGRQIAFGDGDGASLAPLAGALDVVAHEFTHAVTMSSANLAHDHEPGAVNEAVSDIFACLVEHAVRGAAADWVVGGEVRHGGLRDLADPHRLDGAVHLGDRVQTDDDEGGVHVNSTIVSHAAWLMTVGGRDDTTNVSVAGIGTEAAEKIWYRAVTQYLTSRSGFRDVADATLAATDDLYGPSSPQATAVENAWIAAGVLTR